MQKTAIRYLRFSKEGQSHSSIEWQDTNTAHWCASQNVRVIDTFIDQGYSARNFERPDFEKLSKFITKHHRTVDYLVVSQMDRFSRDAGEAISMVKELQLKFNIQIVSVSEGLTYDYYMPGSHFRSGLQLLLAEDDNINRTQKIRDGIYVAKAKEGRFIGSHAPYGYRKEGHGKDKRLVIHEPEAKIVRYIYSAFLSGIPFKNIYENACSMGMKRKGNSSIQILLKNPIYSGRQQVKPWKNFPGGIFPANHEPIIDLFTWNQVQYKLKPGGRENFVQTDQFPLRGVLYCHCGRLLTAANSRGKMGNYYGYYKCNTTSKHNNISAERAHAQMLEIMQHLSIPEKTIGKIRKETTKMIKVHQTEQRRVAAMATKKLVEVENSLFNLEKKWISDSITFETYQRWHQQWTTERQQLKAQIEEASSQKDTLFNLLEREIENLTDMRGIYELADTSTKKQLLELVFDNQLYYLNGAYRTRFIFPLFAHNINILNKKGLLVLEEERDFAEEIPSGGAAGNRTLVQTYSS